MREDCRQSIQHMTGMCRMLHACSAHFSYRAVTDTRIFWYWGHHCWLTLEIWEVLPSWGYGIALFSSFFFFFTPFSPILTCLDRCSLHGVFHMWMLDYDDWESPDNTDIHNPDSSFDDSALRFCVTTGECVAQPAPPIPPQETAAGNGHRRPQWTAPEGVLGLGVQHESRGFQCSGNSPRTACKSMALTRSQRISATPTVLCILGAHVPAADACPRVTEAANRHRGGGEGGAGGAHQYKSSSDPQTRGWGGGVGHQGIKQTP